jgi:hypothetical protein
MFNNFREIGTLAENFSARPARSNGIILLTANTRIFGESTVYSIKCQIDEPIRDQGHLSNPVYFACQI